MPIDEGTLYSYVAGRVRERREVLGKTQAELANAVGVLRTSINNIENVRQKPPLHLIYRIAEALDWEVSNLLPARREVQKQQEFVDVNINGNVRKVLPKTAQALQAALEDLDTGAQTHETKD